MAGSTFHRAQLVAQFCLRQQQTMNNKTKWRFYSYHWFSLFCLPSPCLSSAMNVAHLIQYVSKAWSSFITKFYIVFSQVVIPLSPQIRTLFSVRTLVSIQRVYLKVGRYDHYCLTWDHLMTLDVVVETRECGGPIKGWKIMNLYFKLWFYNSQRMCIMMSAHQEGWEEMFRWPCVTVKRMAAMPRGSSPTQRCGHGGTMSLACSVLLFNNHDDSLLPCMK